MIRAATAAAVCCWPAIRMEPLASSAIPTGLVKLPPEEIVVWGPVTGSTPMIAPPQAVSSTTRMSPSASRAIPTGSTKVPEEDIENGLGNYT
jgi:hypothetical protein